MSEGFTNPLVGGGGALQYPSIHSPGFIPGVVGWTINKDGSVEFNSGTFRGTITDGGMFTYNGTPALGNHPVLSITRPGVTTDQFGNTVVANAVTTYNAFGAAINIMDMGRGAFFQYRDLGNATQGILILSIASVAGTDAFGNHYPVGQFGEDPFGNAIQVVGSSINLFNALIAAATGGRIAIAAAPNPPGNTNPYIKIDAPEQVAAGHMQMLLQGTSPDGTQPGQCLIGQVSGSGGLLAPTSNSMLEVQSNISGASPAAQLCVINAADPYLGMRTLVDANNRLRFDGTGTAGGRIGIKAGPGGGTTQDTKMANTAVKQWATDQMVAFDPVAGYPTPETDHSLGTIGFGNLTLNVDTYRMLADGRVWISVKAVAAGAIAANTFNFTVTLPAVYRPGTTTDLPVVLPGAATNRLTIATTGVVSLTLPALVAGNRVSVQGAYDLQ